MYTRPRPIFRRPPFRPFFYSYPQYYAPHPGYGFLWGLPFLFSQRPAARVAEDSYIIDPVTVKYDYDIEPSSRMRLNMRDVRRLNAELREELDKNPTDKEKAVELYSEIRIYSQEIADESFYDYLDIVDTLPVNKSNAGSVYEIPDGLSFQMRAKARDVQAMTHNLNTELQRRPVDKVKALELYTDIRISAQEIADERFFEYLDSID